MKKSVIAFIAVATIGIWLVIFQVYTKRTTTVNLIPAKSPAVLLPIEINGKVIHFLWDTGSNYSIISQKVADSINLNPTDKKRNMHWFILRRTVLQSYSEMASLKLGDFEIDHSLVIDDEEQTNEGILGWDIIGRYSWLFDFKKGLATISEKEQKIQIGANEQLYEIELITSETDPRPRCKITVNDTIQEVFLFDSGCLGNYRGDEYFLSDFAFILWENTDVDSTYSYLQSYSKSLGSLSLFSGGREEKGCFFYDVNICGYNAATSFAMIEKDSFYQRFATPELFFGTNNKIKGAGFIATGFLRRFDRIYLDPKRKKLSLIKSSDRPDMVTESLNKIITSIKQSLN